MRLSRLALLVALVLPGCVVYDDTSSATIAWDPADTCFGLGASTVFVNVVEAGDSFGTSARVPCEAGGVSFADLNPDTYIVLLDAELEPGVPLVHLEDEVPVHPGDNVFSYRF